MGTHARDNSFCGTQQHPAGVPAPCCPRPEFCEILFEIWGGRACARNFAQFGGSKLAKCGKVTDFAHYFGFDVDEVYLLQRKCTVQLAGLLHTRSPLTSLLALVVKQEAPSIYYLFTLPLPTV